VELEQSKLTRSQQ